MVSTGLVIMSWATTSGVSAAFWAACANSWVPEIERSLAMAVISRTRRISIWLPLASKTPKSESMVKALAPA
jgi:hypothetical protein